jgi:mRNA-degrading endonuclease RelE of RelBE toxin-antitoxin system
MSFSIVATVFFEQELKALAKRHRSLKNDLAVLLGQLQEDPFTGVEIGNHCRKIRLAITSKGKGKSGGARVITYIQVTGNTVYLISIYDKSDMVNIDDSILKKRLKNLM